MAYSNTGNNPGNPNASGYQGSSNKSSTGQSGAAQSGTRGKSSGSTPSSRSGSQSGAAQSGTRGKSGGSTPSGSRSSPSSSSSSRSSGSGSRGGNLGNNPGNPNAPGYQGSGGGNGYGFSRTRSTNATTPSSVGPGRGTSIGGPSLGSPARATQDVRDSRGPTFSNTDLDMNTRPSYETARSKVSPTGLGVGFDDRRMGDISSVDRVAGMTMAPVTSDVANYPRAPGNRIGTGAFTGSNLPAVDDARFGPPAAGTYAPNLATNALAGQKMAASPAYQPGPTEFAAPKTRGLDVGVGIAPTLETAAALKAARPGLQRNAFDTQRAPTSTAVASIPSVPPTNRDRFGKTVPTATVAADYGGVTPAEYERRGKQVAADEEEGPTQEEQQTAEYDSPPPTEAPPEQQRVSPTAAAVQTPKPVAKPTPTEIQKKEYKRSRRGFWGALGIDLATGLHPVGWALQGGAMLLTGDSLGGAMMDAAGGKWGENQYRQGSQDRQGTSGGGPAVRDGDNPVAREREARATTVKKPVETPPTFEEKYLAFNDPTWRPTPEQKWGATPTHSEYV